MMAEKIYCPRCGKAARSGESFCRTCGLELAEVAQIVSGNVENAPETAFRPNPKFITTGIAIFILGTVLGLGHAILRDLDLYPQIYGKTVFMLFIMAGMLTLGLAFVFPSKRFKKRRGTQTEVEVTSADKLATAPLRSLPNADEEKFAIPFPRKSRDKEPASITEHTTRQL